MENMESKEMGEVIASRTFTLLHSNGELLVEIGKPQSFPDSGYYCPIRISGGGIDRFKQVAGVDAVQALQLGLQMIRVDLAAINKKLDQALRWNGDTELGF
jgi:hypothetical protein